jgi:hypothetical protein
LVGKSGLRIADDGEPDSFIELQGRASGHLQTHRPAPGSLRDRVLDERSPDAPLHVRRIDEQPGELGDCPVGGDHD